MKKALSIASAFVAVGTGWAIYAGVTQTPSFPMWEPLAITIGVSIIALDIAIGALITDIYRFNQAARNQIERQTLMPLIPAWIVLSGAVVAEVVLSLLIVVFSEVAAWGVLVFPPLTVAGVFVTALRYDLETRETLREELRKPKPKKETRTKPKETKLEEPQPVSKPVLNYETLETWFKQHPDATQKQAAEYFQVSHTAISKRLKNMYSIPARQKVSQ